MQRKSRTDELMPMARRGRHVQHPVDHFVAVAVVGQALPLLVAPGVLSGAELKFDRRNGHGTRSWDDIGGGPYTALRIAPALSSNPTAVHWPLMHVFEGAEHAAFVPYHADAHGRPGAGGLSVVR